MNHSPTQKSWQIDAVALAVMLAAAAALYFFQIAPAFSARRMARTTAQSLLAAQATARDLARKQRTLNDQLEAVKAAAAGSELKLQPADALNSRLALLTDLASSTSVQIDSIESGTLLASARYASVPLKLTGQGNYRACAALLRELRAQMPDVAVTSMELDAGNHAVADAPGVLSLELTWHTQPIAAQPKK